MITFHKKRAFLKVSAFIVLFSMIDSFVFAGPPQRRSEKENLVGHSSSKSVSKSLDSAISEIASEIERITHGGYISRYDSLHLKELSSRISFLATLSNNIKDDVGDSESDVQQDKLSISILIFGFLLMVIVLFYQFKQKKEINNVSFKLLGLVFIGTVSVFLIPAGFDNNQITPVIGLLGTLAGYLIGASKEGIEANKSGS